MNCIIYNRESREIINIIPNSHKVENKVIYAETIIVDISNEDDIESLLTNNNYEIGDVLPIALPSEPIDVLERIDMLENMILMMMEG